MKLSEFPEVQENILLSKHTSMRVGGPARFFATVASVEALKNIIIAAKAEKIPFAVLGGGCNTIANDEGYDGLVIHPNFLGIEHTECPLPVTCGKEHMRIGAGVSMAALGQKLAAMGLAGFEWGTSIPGAIGGGLVGNAGCFGGEMKDVVEQVKVLNTNTGAVESLNTASCNFQYRNSVFKKNRSWIIIEAIFALPKGDTNTIRARIKEIMARKQEVQPLDVSTAGCIFKNSPATAEELDVLTGKGIAIDAFARAKSWVPCRILIENIGARGMRVGGIGISEKHGNFFYNTGNGTAKDLRELIAIIKEKVRETYGIELKEEVQYLG